MFAALKMVLGHSPVSVPSFPPLEYVQEAPLSPSKEPKSTFRFSLLPHQTSRLLNPKCSALPFYAAKQNAIKKMFHVLPKHAFRQGQTLAFSIFRKIKSAEDLKFDYSPVPKTSNLANFKSNRFSPPSLNKTVAVFCPAGPSIPMILPWPKRLCLTNIPTL